MNCTICLTNKGSISCSRCHCALCSGHCTIFNDESLCHVCFFFFIMDQNAIERPQNIQSLSDGYDTLNLILLKIESQKEGIIKCSDEQLLHHIKLFSERSLKLEKIRNRSKNEQTKQVMVKLIKYFKKVFDIAIGIESILQVTTESSSDTHSNSVPNKNRDTQVMSNVEIMTYERDQPVNTNDTDENVINIKVEPVIQQEQLQNKSEPVKQTTQIRNQSVSKNKDAKSISIIKKASVVQQEQSLGQFKTVESQDCYSKNSHLVKPAKNIMKTQTFIIVNPEETSQYMKLMNSKEPKIYSWDRQIMNGVIPKMAIKRKSTISKQNSNYVIQNTINTQSSPKKQPEMSQNDDSTVCLTSSSVIKDETDKIISNIKLEPVIQQEQLQNQSEPVKRTKQKRKQSLSKYKDADSISIIKEASVVQQEQFLSQSETVGSQDCYSKNSNLVKPAKNVMKTQSFIIVDTEETSQYMKIMNSKESRIHSWDRQIMNGVIPKMTTKRRSTNGKQNSNSVSQNVINAQSSTQKQNKRLKHDDSTDCSTSSSVPEKNTRK